MRCDPVSLRPGLSPWSDRSRPSRPPDPGAASLRRRQERGTCRRARDARVAALALMLALGASSRGWPADPKAAEPAPRCKVGLVLSGGGARGAAHIGVLKVMEELRIPVDCIAGTSMGSIVGALYSAGYSPEEMERLIEETDWADALWDAPHRERESFRRKQDDRLALLPMELGMGPKGISSKSGLSGGAKIDLLFRGLTLEFGGLASFDRLRIPYRAVAADLQNGAMVVLDRGDLARAMRASMSIPGVFSPVEVDGRMLIDGGIARNLPVDVAREMGAGKIIAVDVGTPPQEDVRHLSALGVLSQTMSVLTEKNVEASRREIGPEDLLITPPLGTLGAGDFTRAAEAISIGEEAARGQEAELRRFSVSEAEYGGFLKKQRRESGAAAPPLRIDRIDIEGIRRVPPGVVLRRMKTRPGEDLNVPVLFEDLDRIAQLGDFESVGYRVDSAGGENHLVIEAREKSWGPAYLRFGIAAEATFQGNNDFNATLYHRRPEINRFGAEWKSVLSIGNPAVVSTEFYQPLEPGRNWFVAPRLVWTQDAKEAFLPNGDLEGVKTREGSAGLDFGLQFRNYGEMRLGVIRGRVKMDPTTETTFAPIDAETGGARFQFAYDQLDNVFFPTRGNHTELEMFFSRASLGADDEYDKASLQTTQAVTWGRDTFVGAATLGTDFGSEVPFYAQFELGGFLNLSGYPRGSLRGEVKALFSLADYWRVANLGSVGQVYAGGAVQAGNVWASAGEAGLGDLIYSGTLFLGVNTKFIPVYLGFGLAEGGNSAEYLFIGRPF
jgi:NTE family protein